MLINRTTLGKIGLVLLVALIQTGEVYAQTATQNYVMSMTAREEITGSLFMQRADQTKVQTDVSYIDGLGRSLQEVMREASPGGNDLVKMYTYDAMGRPDKEYLPYETGTVSGELAASPLTGLNAFYTNPPTGVVNINYPYSQSSFELSPLGRVLETGSPGDPWKHSLNGGTHGVQYGYRQNSAGEVRKFTVSLNELQTIGTTSNYAAGLLWVNEVTDEDGNKTQTFTNKTGQVICKKAAVGTPEETLTYYVYDIYDRLTYVIPPEAVVKAGSNWSLLNDFTFRRQWLFRYRYDERNRMIEKQVPGAAMVEMVYDKRDRLVFTLDGNRRAIGSSSPNVQFVETGTLEVDSYQGKSYARAPGARIVLKKPNFQASKLDQFSVLKSSNAYPSDWIYTKYDALNRPVLTGIKSMIATRASLQAEIDQASNYDFAEHYVGTTASDVQGYDNTSYPTASNGEILTVTYYDNYDFVDDFMGGTSNDDYEHSPAQSQAVGLVTGGRTRVIGAGAFLNSTTYYDDRYRVIATCTEYIYGDADKVVMTYRNEVSPLVTKTVTTHRKGSESTTVTENVTYDHRDRLLTHTHKINSGPTITLATNDYNAIGQLIEKDMSNASNALVQSVDYRYNERGWLTTINGGAGNLGASDQFGMELKYEDAPAPNYNGNIGQMLWKTLGGTGQTTGSQDYQYTYDPLNRLLSANYTGSGNFDVSNLTYDKNANLLTLQRNTIDHNNNAYLVNQLTRLEDATVTTQGSKIVYTT